MVDHDLQPKNIFITKVLDFGLAKPAQKAVAEPDDVPLTSPHTAVGVVMGTASYISPEQVRGEGSDPRTDIFSFCALLYEMLSGMGAFRRDTAAETMTGVLKDDPSELSDPGRLVSPTRTRT
jgi:eukaryotic-like serine/threonine-protein kinase